MNVTSLQLMRVLQCITCLWSGPEGNGSYYDNVGDYVAAATGTFSSIHTNLNPKSM